MSEHFRAARAVEYGLMERQLTRYRDIFDSNADAVCLKRTATMRGMLEQAYTFAVLRATVEIVLRHPSWFHASYALH